MLKINLKYNVKIPPDSNNVEKVGWKYYSNEWNRSMLDEDALDLLTKLVVIDPNERLTAQEALKHRFFNKNLD